MRSAADLGRALGKEAEARSYDQQADVLAKAIDKYFGAKVEGFDTYRYYDGNDVLRSWICLPLCMGLMDRRDGTIAALFSPRLWTADGLASQAGDLAFWDRSTLYGLRGVFQAGETTTGLRYLTAYTGRRLLGDHVPYPVEAWPEGDQRHLSSESGLYCRIFTEGLFGMRPTGLDRFRCTPRLPDGWPRMALRSVRAFNRDLRRGGGTQRPRPAPQRDPRRQNRRPTRSGRRRGRRHPAALTDWGGPIKERRYLIAVPLIGPCASGLARFIKGSPVHGTRDATRRPCSLVQAPLTGRLLAAAG